MFKTNFLRIKNFSQFIIIRFKSKKSNVFKNKNKIQNTDLAMRHYDNYYSKIYGNQWQSIRLGLLSPKKYMAIINNFVDYELIENEMKNIGAYNLRDIYVKNLQKFLKNLKNNHKIKINYDDDQLLNEFNEYKSTESEDIKSFLTNTQNFDDDNDEENNQASIELDLNQFVPVTELKYKEKVVNENEYFDFYDINHKIDIDYIDEKIIEMPILLNLYTFKRNDFSEFPSAKLSKNNLYNYYLIDGASILPILIMNIKENDFVGDFCAAPGGKSLLMYLQQIKNCKYFLNDISKSRLDRLKNVINSFIPINNINNTITINNCDVMDLKKYNQFDKILVDVPCTNDRHSLYVNDNNIFSRTRLNERLNLPYKQLNILCEALKSIKIGGYVIYSTCSLSPIQNDGVIHMALKYLQQNDQLYKYSIINLKNSLHPFENLYKFDYSFRYGIQVLPNICTNFGPMYFCKILRTA